VTGPVSSPVPASGVPDLNRSSAIIDADLATFLTERVSLIVAVVADSGVPDLALALGCRVDVEAGRIDLILDEAVATSLLTLVKAGRQEVALVASRPSDLRTVQVKGGNARLQSFPLPWLDALEQGIRGRRDELAKIEFGGSYAATLYHFSPESLVCLRFDASAVFEQTPGPKAGQQLAGAS